MSKIFKIEAQIVYRQYDIFGAQNQKDDKLSNLAAMLMGTVLIETLHYLK